MQIIDTNKYYILVNGDRLLAYKPWKFIGSGISQYEERAKAKYSKDHWDKQKVGKLIYTDLKLIEIDVLNPEKSKIVRSNKIG